MSCGGTAVLFVEPLRAAPHLWIFGAGHIAAALAPLAASVGFRAVVVDDRPAFADPARFPEATRVVCGEWAELARGVDPGSFVAIATHGHEHDEEVLAEVAAIEPALPYIGMIGSRGKVPGILARLRARGISVGENVFSPIGLDLGGGSPAEIAISIASEILGVLHGKAGLPHCRLRLDRQEDREG